MQEDQQAVTYIRTNPNRQLDHVDLMHRSKAKIVHVINQHERRSLCGLTAKPESWTQCDESIVTLDDVCEKCCFSYLGYRKDYAENARLDTLMNFVRSEWKEYGFQLRAIGFAHAANEVHAMDRIRATLPYNMREYADIFVLEREMKEE